MGSFFMGGFVKQLRTVFAINDRQNQIRDSLVEISFSLEKSTVVHLFSDNS